jgi:hypothetical protein
VFQALVGERLMLGLRYGGIDNEWIDSFMLTHLAFVQDTEKDSKGNMLTRAGLILLYAMWGFGLEDAQGSRLISGGGNALSERGCGG